MNGDFKEKIVAKIASENIINEITQEYFKINEIVISKIYEEVLNYLLKIDRTGKFKKDLSIYLNDSSDFLLDKIFGSYTLKENQLYTFFLEHLGLKLNSIENHGLFMFMNEIYQGEEIKQVYDSLINLYLGFNEQKAEVLDILKEQLGNLTKKIYEETLNNFAKNFPDTPKDEIAKMYYFIIEQDFNNEIIKRNKLIIFNSVDTFVEEKTNTNLEYLVGNFDELYNEISDYDLKELFNKTFTEVYGNVNTQKTIANGIQIISKSKKLLSDVNSIFKIDNKDTSKKEKERINKLKNSIINLLKKNKINNYYAFLFIKDILTYLFINLIIIYETYFNNKWEAKNNIKLKDILGDEILRTISIMSDNIGNIGKDKILNIMNSILNNFISLEGTGFFKKELGLIENFSEDFVDILDNFTDEKLKKILDKLFNEIIFITNVLNLFSDDYFLFEKEQYNILCRKIGIDFNSEYFFKDIQERMFELYAEYGENILISDFFGKILEKEQKLLFEKFDLVEVQKKIMFIKHFFGVEEAVDEFAKYYDIYKILAFHQIIFNSNTSEKIKLFFGKNKYIQELEKLKDLFDENKLIKDIDKEEGKISYVFLKY